MSEEKAPPNFSSLTENLNQQQAKISALKELVRQSESQHGRNTASAQEKVKNIAQRLSNLKSKAAKSKIHRASSEISEDYSITHYEEEENEVADNIPSTSRNIRSETPGSEKITLLRKQMELNRMKMAERENKSKEIEQMVTQLRSRFETSQMSLEKSVELGRSMGDLSTSIPSVLLHSQNRSVSDVSHTSSQPLYIENERIKFLEKRIRELEMSLSEKENLGEAEAMQRLERKIMDLEENIKEKESIIEARTKAVTLLTENLSKKKKNVVDSLEDTKQEMFKMQETFIETELAYRKDKERLQKLLDEKSNEVTNLVEKNEILEKSRYELTIENSDLKTKLEEVQDYSSKISELNKLNENLQLRISTLESQRYDFITEDEVGEAKLAEDKVDYVQKIKDLENTIIKSNEEIEKLQETLQEKTIEVSVVNANMTVLQEKYNVLYQKQQPLFSNELSNSDEDSQSVISKLKQQLDDSNKSMIKTKLKMKQMQKQIDAFQKSSDGSHEISRLNEEIQVLIQKIAELEEEKGSYQLQLVGNENQSDLEQRVKVLETTCQNQNTAIQLLEEQKAEISDALLKNKEGYERVTELEARIKELEALNDALECKMLQSIEEKEALGTQLNQYLNENMELLDKLEKISKGSSAESIEMVANLTAQEKLEIEQYQKELTQKDEEVPIEISQELNESLRSLRMESSELMEKIELFTIERREVLEKLDALTVENQVLNGKIEKLQDDKKELEHQLQSLKEEREEFEATVLNLNAEKDKLSVELFELSEHRKSLQEEINKLVKDELKTSSTYDSSLKKNDNEDYGQPSSSIIDKTSSIDREACEKLLKQLDSEIQNFNRNKDKNQKLKISKKLTDNAKNVHAMMTNLLVEFYKNLDNSKQLREDLEELKILLNNLSTDKSSEEIQSLKNELDALSDKLMEKQNECDSLQMKVNEVNDANNENISVEIKQLKFEIENVNEQSKRKDSLISTLQETIDTLTNERDRYETEVQKQMSLVNDLRNEFDQLCADVKINNQRLNEKSVELDQLQHEFDMRLKTSTNEVEILKTLVAEQKQLLIDSYQEHELDINQKMKEINDYDNQVKQLKAEVDELKSQQMANQESYTNSMRLEIKKINDLLSASNSEIETQKEALLHKQETIDTLNTQIIELYKSIEENANKIVEKEDEIQYLQEIVDSNRTQLHTTHEKLVVAEKTITDLTNQLSNKIDEIELMRQKTSIPEQDPVVNEKFKKMQSDVQTLESKNKELHEKLKKYAATLKKKQAQCNELEEKLSATNSANTSISATDINVVNELKAKIMQYEEQLNSIKMENSKLNESLQQSSSSLLVDECDDLRWKIDEYKSTIDHKSKEILNLQIQIKQLSDNLEQNGESIREFQRHIKHLEDENSILKEAFERKCNDLNSVTLENQELKNKTLENVQSEDKKKMEKLKAAAVQLKHKLQDKKREVENLQAEITSLKSLSHESVSAQEEVVNLKEKIKNLDEMNEKILSETKIAYDNDIGLLKQRIEELDSMNRILVEEKQRKVSLEGQLETFEMTNIELREKVARLEEAFATLETEKNALEREKLSLADELQEKDELIGQKLRETESENTQLNEGIRKLNEERNSLLQKLNSLETQISTDHERYKVELSNIESDKNHLQQQIDNLLNDFKKLQTSHEQTLTAKHAEIDEIESQFSSQLQKVEAEKKTIQEALEKANDKIVDYQDEIIRLRDNVHSLEQARGDLEREISWLNLQNENYTQDQLECEQLRIQLMQSETELENLRSQNETIILNHEAEVIILKQQITDLEQMRSQVSQNQTDDQVMLQNENVKLKELLIEKENEIQQKAMQLQMATMFEAPVQIATDLFSNLQETSNQQLPVTSNTDSINVKNLQEKLKELNDEMKRLKESQTEANMELDIQSGKIQELLRENKNLQERTHEMQSVMDNLIRKNVELEAANERQKNDIKTKDKEINEIKDEMCALRDHQDQSIQSTDDDKFHTLQSELVEKNRVIENLEIILKKYESQTTMSPLNPAQQEAPVSTSMLFIDTQPSTSSLFDDSFNIPQQPIVEEVFQSKKAYVYNQEKCNIDAEAQTHEQWKIDDEDKNNQILQLKSQIQSLNQQIMEQYLELENQRQRIIELDLIKKVSEQENPQVEPECVSKKAYICYNCHSTGTQTELNLMDDYQLKIERLENQIKILEQESSSKSLLLQPQERLPLVADTSSFFDTIAPVQSLEIEDTWGWESETTCSAQDALNVQQLQTQKSLLSPRSNLEVKLQEKCDIIEKIECEKISLNEELNTMRENSKKMMKKLKEYQQKIKDMELVKRQSSSFDNEMDLVIQEELKLQIQKLENRLKELCSEKEKEVQEKEALNKKVEILSNANDRMIELKERQDVQMEMYQLKIKDLSQKLQTLNEWGNESKDEKEIISQTSENNENNEQILNEKIKELRNDLKDLQIDNEELQALLEEERNNNKILESRLAKIDSEQSINEITKDEEIQRLSQQISSKNHEIQELISKIDELSSESVSIKEFLDDLRMQVQLKTNENEELNNRLQKLEVNRNEFSQEQQLYNQSIKQEFEHQLRDFENKIESLQGEVQYKNIQIGLLNEENEKLLAEQVKGDLGKTDETIKIYSQKADDQIIPSVEKIEDFNSRIAELETVNAELIKEKAQMEHELQVLNDQVLASLEFEDRMKNIVLELDAKNIEIQMLKTTIDRIHSRPQSTQIDTNEFEKLRQEKDEIEKKTQSAIDLLNAHWSQMVEQRGNEVANSWKQHLEMKEAEFAEVEAKLRASLTQSTHAKDSECKTIDESDTLIKMKSIMESQEVEIVSLKEQLAIRSAEYAALSAKVDPYHQMSTSMNVSPVSSSDSDKVPRSELDLALYMLHQRDMRLEEITMELVRLLEERDTLQLRLSNAIRQIEEIKKKFSIETTESSDQSTPEKHSVKTDEEQLKAKLSELNTVRHLRDKDIAEEREKRFAEHMSLFQRDVANIPHEAAARIVSGSDQNQSPSSVLVNWILGKKPESS